MEDEWLKDFKGVCLLNPYLRPFLLAIITKNKSLRHYLFRF